MASANGITSCSQLVLAYTKHLLSQWFFPMIKMDCTSLSWTIAPLNHIWSKFDHLYISIDYYFIQICPRSNQITQSCLEPRRSHLLLREDASKKMHQSCSGEKIKDISPCAQWGSHFFLVWEHMVSPNVSTREQKIKKSWDKCSNCSRKGANFIWIILLPLWQFLRLA